MLQLDCIAKYLFFSFTYYYIFKNKLIKKAIILSIIIISIAFCLNAIFIQHFNKAFPTNIYAPAQILLAVFSMLLFKEMLMYPVRINIIKQSVFWYNTGILFYTTTMFFNLGLSNYLANINVDDNFIFDFWYFSTFVFYIFIGIAILAESKINKLTDA